MQISHDELALLVGVTCLAVMFIAFASASFAKSTAEAIPRVVVMILAFIGIFSGAFLF